MTKLELSVSALTFDCVSIEAKTAALLGVNGANSTAAAAGVVNLASLLADEKEFGELQQCVQRLLDERCENRHNNRNSNWFTTLNLVFLAPHAETLVPVGKNGRAPLDEDGDVVSCSPVRAFHTCHQIHLACFVHVELIGCDDDIDDDDAVHQPTLFHLTAVEYSRRHRRLLIRHEFCAWLLEEHMESAVIATDPLGKVVFWNKFAETLYQWTSHEAIGQNIMNLTPSLMTQEQGAEIFSKLVQGQHWKGFFGVQRKDATPFMAHVTDTPVIDVQGNLKFVVGISADYSQMHNLLEHLEREVEVRTKQVLENERKASEALRRAEQAAAASKSKTEMMHMLSHEFRTPLQGIMSPIQDDDDDSLLHDNLSTILASSRLLLTLINNVLDLGKMEADKMQAIEVSSIPVMPSIQASIQFCEPFALLNDVRLVFDSSSDRDEDCRDLTILANQLRFEQILINLLSNGIKYTNKDTQVLISIREASMEEAVNEALRAGTSDLTHQPDALQQAAVDMKQEMVAIVAVRDHGRGIPESEMANLFEEFVQLEISKEMDRHYGASGGTTAVGQSSGSGLGFSLVLQFVTRMGGHVWVNNNCRETSAGGEGDGATFSFCLPRGDIVQHENDGIVASTNTNMELRAKDCELFRVLLVDDCLINLRVLHRMLARLGVKNVHEFSNAQQAIEHLESLADYPEQLPNLILCDLNMPVMDGFDFIAHVRKDSCIYAKQTAPTAMACSADWTPETEQKCKECGFDGVLRKPILFSELGNFLASLVSDDGTIRIH